MAYEDTQHPDMQNIFPQDFSLSHGGTPELVGMDMGERSHPSISSSDSRSPFDQLAHNGSFMAQLAQQQSGVSSPSLVGRWGEGPWHPLHTTGPNNGLEQFTIFRPPLKSDASSVTTSPQDSGYATKQDTYSIASGAEPAYTNQDCSEVTDPFGNFRPFSSRQRRSTNYLDTSRSPQSSDARSQTRSTTQSHPCRRCGEVFRLQSEHKKHMLKHEKPFRCNQPLCPKSDVGFTTINDLDRHKRSKHKIFGPGQEKVYKCAAQKCAGKQKVWPRLDNFRQHVKRIHEGEDEEELVKWSECTAESQQGIGMDPMAVTKGETPEDEPPSFDPDMNEYSLDLWTSFPSDGGQSSTGGVVFEPSSPLWTGQSPMGPSPFSSYQQNTAFAGGATTASSFDAGQRPVIVYGSQESQESRQDDLHGHARDLAMQVDSKDPNASLVDVIYKFLAEKSLLRSNSSLPQSGSTFDPQRLGGYPSRSGGSDVESPSVDSHSSRGFPADMGSPPSSNPDHAKGSVISPPQERRTWGEAGVRCDRCEKRLSRQCDLKKHMRRHTKPFGCTFDGCYKTFGSKNDWKRHENSQHFQEDSWRCELPLAHTGRPGTAAPQQPCAQLFQRKPDFAAHLINTHGIKEKPRWIEECKQRRIGVNGQRSFWCGFCRRIIALKGQGTKALDDRFNHIANHFTKDKRSIYDWLPPEGSKTKGELEKDLRSELVKRSEDEDEGIIGHDICEEDGTTKLQRNQDQIDSSVLDPADSDLRYAPRKRKREDQQDNFLCCRCGKGPYSMQNSKDGRCSFDSTCNHVFCDVCLRSRAVPSNE